MPNKTIFRLQVNQLKPYTMEYAKNYVPNLNNPKIIDTCSRIPSKLKPNMLAELSGKCKYANFINVMRYLGFTNG